MRPARRQRCEEVESGTMQVCPVCGDDWFLADGQAAWFARRGWVVPKRCEACRHEQRSRKDDGQPA
jgi:hypothetical protein